MPAKMIMLLGSVSGCLSVVLGAFAAHALKNILAANQLDIFATAVKYQMWHSCVLLFIGLVSLQSPLFVWRVAAMLMLLGIVFFSGSLYGLALGGPQWLGPITPLGGASLIAAWVCLIIGSLKMKSL